MKNCRDALLNILAPTRILVTESGVEFEHYDGPAVWVKNSAFYKYVMRKANLGLAESYMGRWCEIKQIDELYHQVLTAQLPFRIRSPSLLLQTLAARLFNLQTRRRAKRDTNAHYDLSNEMFRGFLGEVMCYTCGYWNRAEMTLEEANRSLFELISRKLQFSRGQRLLDVGCGWGAFLKYAAQAYGIEGVGVNISEPQLEYCRNDCAGLPIEFWHQDCRYLDTRKYAGAFDAVTGIAMINHIGPKNYDRFFSVMHAVLKDGRYFLLQGIANPAPMLWNDPFYNKYIFNNGVAPSVAQLLRSAERYFTVEDFQNFTSYYPRSLTAWNANFQRNWPEIEKLGFDERFRRMWELFLLSAAGGFRARDLIMFQLVLGKSRPNRVYVGAR